MYVTIATSTLPRLLFSAGNYAGVYVVVPFCIKSTLCTL